MMVVIDRTKFVYLLLYRNDTLLDLVQSKLFALGFDKKQIVNADPRKYGQVGDYFAQIWMPREPTQLFVNKITKTETIQPQREGDGQLDNVQSERIITIELFDK